MAAGPDAILISVGSLAGHKLCQVAANGSWRVRDVKVEIERQLGTPSWQQVLIQRGSDAVLRDRFKLTEVHCCNDVGEQEAPEHPLELLMYRLEPMRAKLLEDMHSGRSRLTLAQLTAEQQEDRALVLSVLECDGLQLQHALPHFRADEEVVSTAVAQIPEALRYAQYSRSMVLAAVTCAGRALRLASTCHRKDPEIVRAAVLADGGALQYAAECRRQDKEIVLAAVSQTGRALQDAAPHLRADKEVVLTAVANDPAALMHAASALQDDAEVVLAASARDCRALQHASSRLRGDKDFVLATIERDARALRFAAPGLRRDETVRSLARRRQRR